MEKAKIPSGGIFLAVGEYQLRDFALVVTPQKAGFCSYFLPVI